WLPGKYQPGQGGPAGSRATDASGAGFIRDYLTDETLTRVAGLRPVAEEAGLSMAQLAIAWVLQNPGVSAAIIGATRLEQVRENVKASSVRLGDEVMRKIDDVLGPVIERDPARTVSPPARPWPRARAGAGQCPGCRLIGPSSPLLSSSRVTWSTPDCSRARQFSPSQFSASPWLPKASLGTSPELAGVPSAFSNRQDHTMSGPPPRPSLTEPPQAHRRAASGPLPEPAGPPGAPGRGIVT